MQFKGLKSIDENNGVKANWVTVRKKLDSCSDLQRRFISTIAVIDNMKPGGYLDVSKLGYFSIENAFKQAIQSGDTSKLIHTLYTYSKSYKSSSLLANDLYMGNALNSIANWIEKRNANS